MVLTLEKSRNKFSKLAWLSSCLSLLIGLSHVRSFPSYNLALSVIALYASVQEDTEILLKSITVCAIMGALSTLADIAFCSLWAREVSTRTKAIISIIFRRSHTLRQPKTFCCSSPVTDHRWIQRCLEVLFDPIHIEYVREDSIALLFNDSRCRCFHQLC